MKKTTLQDMRDILVTSHEGSDRHFWGVVTAQNTNAQGKVTSYEVALGGNEGTMTCRKLAGADVGDTVMVTLQKNGAATVTGTVDGDKDADKALTAAEAAQDDIDAIEDLVGDGDESGITITTQYYLSTSNTEPTGGTWSDTLPTYVDGRYYWTKTVTTYADGSEVESDPILDVGAQLTAEVNSVVTAENQHFWHDSTGAYVTTADQSYSSGYAMKITTNGLLQTYNGNNLMSLTSSGLTFYQSNGSTPMATYSSAGCFLYGGSATNYALMTSSGLDIYTNSTLRASFGSSVRLGPSSGYNVYINSGQLSFLNNQSSIFSVNSYSLSFNPATAWSMGLGSSGFTVSYNSSSKLTVDSSGVTASSGLYSTGQAVVGGALSVGSSVTLNSTVAGNSVSTYNIGMGSAYKLGVYSSSRDKKTDISYEIEDEFDPHQLYDLPVVTFRWKDEYKDQDAWDKDRKQIGFIAEDVHDAYYVGAIHDSTGKTIDWSHRTIIPAMLKLIQEQHDEIELLKRSS